MSITVKDIEQILKSYNFSFTTEAELQAGLSSVFEMESIAFEREFYLTDRDRIDFLIGNIGIEVKIKCSYSNLVRQLQRYTLSAKINSLILITTSLTHQMPLTINQKPIFTINVGLGRAL